MHAVENSLESEGKVLVMGPFDVRTCNRVSGFSDDLTAEEGLAVVAVTTAGAFPSRRAFSLADLSARSFLSACNQLVFRNVVKK